MKFAKEYMRERLLIEPLGEVTLDGPDMIPSCEYSGEEIIINGKSTGIYIAHIDYAEWLENKVVMLDV